MHPFFKEVFFMDKKYQDIIHKPHHVSKHHPQMPMYKRAAQFSPVTMTKADFPEPLLMEEYCAWDGDQSYLWIE